MDRSAPVAMVQPQNNLDSIGYGQSDGMPAAPTAVAYATAPIPVAYDTAYRLDAGGSITMPLIGAVPAHGRTPARRDRVTLTHTDNSGSMRVVVPPGTSLSPGDTVLVDERWF